VLGRSRAARKRESPGGLYIHLARREMCFGVGWDPNPWHGGLKVPGTRGYALLVTRLRPTSYTGSE